jgi:hypothetical protein
MSETSTETGSVFGWKLLHAYYENENGYASLPTPGKARSDYDSSVWEVGKWRSAHGPISTCSNGFHLSPTPKEAAEYVDGSVLAYVEARGDVSHSHDKSAHREMRIVAMWPDVDRTAVRQSSAKAGYPVPAAQKAHDEAVNDAYNTQIAESLAADEKFDQAIQAFRETRNAERQAAYAKCDLATNAARAALSEASRMTEAEAEAEMWTRFGPPAHTAEDFTVPHTA